MPGLIAPAVGQLNVTGGEVTLVDESPDLAIHVLDTTFTGKDAKFQCIGELDPISSRSTREQQAGSHLIVGTYLGKRLIKLFKNAIIDYLSFIIFRSEVIQVLSLGVRNLTVAVHKHLIGEHTQGGGSQIGTPFLVGTGQLADGLDIIQHAGVELRIGAARARGAHLELAIVQIVAGTEVLRIVLGEITGRGAQEVTIAVANVQLHGRQHHVGGHILLSGRVGILVDVQIVITGRQ